MEYKCSQCGHTSTEPGNCPMCGVPMQSVAGDVESAPTTPVEPTAPAETTPPPPPAEEPPATTPPQSPPAV